jgi:hypothetical protein
MSNIEKTPEPTMAEVMARIASIMEQQQQDRQKQTLRQELEDLSTVEARKAGRVLGASGSYENNRPPEVSHYNPLGERDNPRAELKCKMVWVGYSMTKEALTREEVNLLNQVEPGDYRVTKADGSTIDFKVDCRKDRAGRPELMTFHFPCKNREEKMNHMGTVSYLKEVLAQQAERAAAAQ